MEGSHEETVLPKGGFEVWINPHMPRDGKYGAIDPQKTHLTTSFRPFALYGGAIGVGIVPKKSQNFDGIKVHRFRVM